jgi:hypothetical protein
VRQKLAFVLGLLAGVALIRLLRGRRRDRSHDETDARAEELRRKLAESRAAPPPEGEPGPPAAPGPEPGPQAGAEAEVDEARRRVYEEGRAAVDEMRRAGETPPQP